ncbi:MAG TPA: CpsD/CapB family tyrosine-protein kinase [Syntrophorhabdaceae bacterium]
MSRIFDALEHGLVVDNPPVRESSVFEWPVNGHHSVAGVSPLEEEMVTLYHRIRSSLPDVRHPSILVVGSRSNEGASTVARELARTTAMRMDKTVLLVDLDRSRPELNAFRRLRPELEVEALVKQEEPLEKCLCQVEESSLFVLPLFQQTMCTPKILEAVADGEFWKPLKEKFDLIIVDSPPALTLPDGPAIVARVDGVILVVEAEKTRWQVAREAKELILESGGTLLGIVFNKQRSYIPRFVDKYL